MVNRIIPAAPPELMQTFRMSAPRSTHRRRARCEEAGCRFYLKGWTTRVNEATKLGEAQAYYIRHDRTRHYREERSPEGLTVFTFEAGQPCFDSDKHTVRNGRPADLIVVGGDFRGNPKGTRRRHVRAEDFAEDMAETLDRVESRRKKG